jgi:class 3 adenylate cyclase
MVALNADIVGYSRLIADDYEGTTATIADLHHLVDGRIGEQGGTIANFVGDAFMAVFETVEGAVQAAIGITTEVEKRNETLPEGRWVRFRMGIEQGDAGVTEGKYHGDALNVAARIQAIAPAGGIAVSGGVYRALDEPALRFRSMGRKRLKNIPEQVEVYELADLPSHGSGRGLDRSLALEAPTMALLPIHTEGVDDRVRSGAGLIRAELLHRLSRVPGLEVVDAGPEPVQGGPQSTARYMLETGVHQFGERARVFATLFDVTTMNVVKSHKWSVGVDEMFALADEIADEVARAVEVELIVGTPAGLISRLDDRRSIEQVYLGWYHLRNDTKEGWARALELFGQVAEKHPEQPYGHVLVGFAEWLGVAQGWTADPAAMLEDARKHAATAREVGDPTGMSMAVDAAALMSLGRVDEAMRAMDGLEAIRPTCDVTYGLEASVRRFFGEWERAVELLDLAMRLTGINKPWYPTVKAASLYVGGQLERASALAEALLEYQPNNLEALLVLAASQMELGMERRARATAQLAAERFPSVDPAAWLDGNPYQRREVVARWKQQLARAGMVEH